MKWLTAIGVVAVVLEGAPARAGDAEEGFRLYQEAMSLFKAGECGEAMRKYQAAYELSRHANNLYYLGECQRRLGDLRAAHGTYRRFAETLTGARRIELETKLQTLRWGTGCRVSIASSPGGAAVLVDGQNHGRTPRDGAALAVVIPGGRHVVKLALPGHTPIERRVGAEFGEPLALSFALRPLAAASTPATAAAPARPCPLTAAVTADACAARRGRFFLGAGISAAALSAGALALGIAFNHKHNAEFDGSRQVSTYLNTSILGYALAGTLAAASGLSFWLYTRGLSETRQTRQTRGTRVPVVVAGVVVPGARGAAVLLGGSGAF